MRFMYVAKARKILIASSLATGAGFYHDLCLHAIDDQIKHYCLMLQCQIHPLLKGIRIVSCAEDGKGIAGLEGLDLEEDSP
ncbi:hypothetical protein Tco_0726242 [Tanacetum coccineum]|uniref:Uncharacterized protein n=1 Tax=Tanacetum coccineum TaxID=301880 RepID=A0ABQ4YG35_9ASTR